MRRISAMVLSLVSLSVSSFAQAPNSYVESDGVATAYAIPTRVEFWLHLEHTGETVVEAMSKCEGFYGRIQAELDARDLHPADFDTFPMTVTDLKNRRVYVGGRLEFPMATFAKPEQGPRLFAQLCDQILEMSKALECDITGPLLDVADRETVQREAIAQATERAYPIADAVSGSLKNPIFSVDTVRVIEVNWNRPLFSLAAEPNLRQVSCTATVRVTYTLGQQPQQ